MSGGLPWHLMSGIVEGGDMTHSCDDEAVLCDICCCDVCCVAVWAAAAYAAAVLADVLVLSVVAAAVLAAVTVWNAVVELPAAAGLAASVAVAGCFAVESVTVSVDLLLSW